MSISPNQPSKNDKEKLPWQQFRTRDPSTIPAFLDRGRAEIMFSMVVVSNFPDGPIRELTGAAFGASKGNSEILRLLLEPVSQVYPSDSDVFAQIESHWRSFEQHAPDFDCIETLRQICNEHSMPAEMIEAMFDDPTFDFIAYLDWHNS